MKNFQKFLEEASVKGNPGFPGENEKKPGESEYLSDVERRAKQRLGIRPEDTQRRMQMTPMGPMPVPSEKEMRLGRRLMELLKQSLEYTSGKEEQLSQLANVVFLSIYQDLVTRYEIELDIKIVKPGKVKQFMDECEDCEQDPPPQFKELTEEDIKNEVHKRKIANLIIQGEAKNTKHILHSDEVKEGLEEIYSKEDAEEIFKIWDEMTKTADQLDWIIPAEVRAEMMELMPDNLAGACFVDWKPKEVQAAQEEEEAQEEPQEWTGEEDEESMYSEEDEAPMERFDETPLIRARGVDFPMLLHESVKGLFEVLSLGGIPEDPRAAKIALSNTGLSDEPEDWKYGPEVASDLRDFINQSPRINEYPNIREEFYKMMIDKETMPTEKFLELMRGILSKTGEAKTIVDRLVSKVADMIKQEKDDQARYEREMDEYERQLKDWEEYQKSGQQEPTEKEEEDEIEKLIRNSGKEEVSADDYSTWSQRELMDEIDNALDTGDMDKVKMLSQYLKKESKEVVLNELQMILERKNPHTK
jgi:hypothetical protein